MHNLLKKFTGKRLLPKTWRRWGGQN